MYYVLPGIVVALGISNEEGNALEEPTGILYNFATMRNKGEQMILNIANYKNLNYRLKCVTESLLKV